MKMGRYPIEGHEGDDKYQIVFSRMTDDGLYAQAMEWSPEFRAMMLRHEAERSELSAFHSIEKVQFLAAWRRNRKSAAAEPGGEG